MEIYLTRHGQTEWNVLKKIQGKVDIELNENGKEQAKQIGEKLKNTKIDLIICSPLKRAKETAEIINSYLNVPIIFDERISERSFGEFEGMNIETFDFNDLWNYTKNCNHNKVEPLHDLFKRVYQFLDEMKETYVCKNILIVAHGGISIPVTCYFEGISTPENVFPLCLKNCEIKKFICK